MNQYAPQGFRMLPTGVKHLLIINCLMFAILYVGRMTLHINLNALLGLYTPISSGLFRLWQPVTYMFMHANFSHLLFNMFALWMFGYVLENFWGTKRFVIYYFVCGIGAALFSILLSFTGLMPGIHNIVGASGAVYGILLAFGMMFPEERIYLYFFVPIKAKWFVILFAVIEIIQGVFYTSDGVAHFAHLGGMIFGLLLILWWRNGYRR